VCDRSCAGRGAAVDKSKGGTHLRMEQSGFRPGDEANDRGARYGCQRFIAGLERVTVRLD
jgi:hypothetical protein